MKFMHWMRAWVQSRPYRRLWRSFPALAAGAACASFGAVLLCWSPMQAANRYAALVDRALAVHDFATARVASQRRLALGISPRPETLFKLAEAVDGLGGHQEAYAVMTKLASEDGPGYAPAHLLLAQTLLREGQLTAPVLRTVELHLAYGTQLEPNSRAARAMIEYLHEQFQAWEAGQTNRLILDPNALATHEVAGWVFFQTQDWRAAKPHLLAEVKNNPTVNIMLADLSVATGDPAGNRFWTQEAESVYRAKVEKAAVDVPADRLAWVQAEVRLDHFDTARQILESGEKLSGTNAYYEALGVFYAAWAQYYTRTQPADLADRLQCLQKGLESDPNNASLILQLTTLSHLVGPESKIAGDILDKLLSDGLPAARRLTVLGMTSWQQGDQDLAQSYLRRAYKLAPTDPDVINNMALMLALNDQPDLDEALRLVQSLLDIYPEQPHYRDTRGQIYVLMGRYEDGVRDLEFALPRLNNPQSTEKNLGRAYRMLAGLNGNPKLMDIAVRYEKLAAGIAPTTP